MFVVVALVWGHLRSSESERELTVQELLLVLKHRLPWDVHSWIETIKIRNSKSALPFIAPCGCCFKPHTLCKTSPTFIVCFQIKNAGSKMCLDVGDKNAEGKPVILYQCHKQGGNQVRHSPIQYTTLGPTNSTSKMIMNPNYIDRSRVQNSIF